MERIGIIGNADKETIIEVINFLKSLKKFKVVYVKQGKEKLYIVTDRVFNVLQEANNE